MIYFSLTERGEIVLVMLYAKAELENVTTNEIKKSR